MYNDQLYVTEIHCIIILNLDGLISNVHYVNFKSFYFNLEILRPYNQTQVSLLLTKTMLQTNKQLVKKKNKTKQNNNNN